MKDGFDIVTDIRSLINIPSITGLITGKIWPTELPSGRTETDIAINSLGITNTQDQIGHGNVNIHAPNLIETVGGKSYPMPNQALLNSISKAVTPYLDGQYRPSFRTKVEEAGQLLQDTDGSWFVNIRVKYYSLQTDFKHV